MRDTCAGSMILRIQRFRQNIWSQPKSNEQDLHANIEINIKDNRFENAFLTSETEKGYNTMIFDCLPTLIMFTVNIVFFIISVCIIQRVQKGLRRTIPKEEKFQRQYSLISWRDK